MLKKRISFSQKFASLASDKSRLLWLMMLPHCDSQGRIEADFDFIKGSCVPKLKFSKSAIKRSLRHLHDAGLIMLYEADGKSVLQFVNFRKYNKIRDDREADSELPAPPGQQENSGSTPPQKKLTEMKLNEVKSSEQEHEHKGANVMERKKVERKRTEGLSEKTQQRYNTFIFEFLRVLPLPKIADKTALLGFIDQILPRIVSGELDESIFDTIITEAKESCRQSRKPVAVFFDRIKKEPFCYRNKDERNKVGCAAENVLQKLTRGVV